MECQIYQAKEGSPYLFAPTPDKEIPQSEYEMVYTFCCSREPKTEKERQQLLEYIFEVFNLEHPSDYRGRSLSVGDIVALGNQYYYCGSCSWRKVRFK